MSHPGDILFYFVLILSIPAQCTTIYESSSRTRDVSLVINAM